MLSIPSCAVVVWRGSPSFACCEGMATPLTPTFPARGRELTGEKRCPNPRYSSSVNPL